MRHGSDRGLILGVGLLALMVVGVGVTSLVNTRGVRADATQVTRLECFGNVVAVAGDRWAHGDHADYDTVKEILVMTGNPEARQGNNTMHGERVVFYVDTDLIEVQNVKGTLESKGKEPGAKKSPPSTP